MELHLSATTTTDQPSVDANTFSASLVETPGLEHSLTVNGEAVGDYRTQGVSLTRAKHQESRHTLMLDVQAIVGSVENPHPALERAFSLQYNEAPAAYRYTHVLIMNGQQRFTITVQDVV